MRESNNLMVVRWLASSALALTLLPSCASPSDAPLKLQPAVSHQHAAYVTITLSDDARQARAEVDTGSIYAFVGTPGDELTCQSPSRFHWGAGYAEFCPRTAPLKAISMDGTIVELHPALRMGEATFHEWLGPDAIIGLSANMSGANIGGLEPVIQQLNPEVMSFRFPNGPMNDGVMQFAPLSSDQLRGSRAVPLVDPGSLEYGYTANISRVDFLVANEIKASIMAGPDGVYLKRDGTRSRIAEKNLAFFDTGATEPYVPLNGDISLLSDRVSEAVIFPKGNEPYDEVRFTLDVGADHQVVLSNKQIRSYGTGEPGLALPTAADFPQG